IGKIYHLTGPQSENMHFYAQEYSKALGRTVTFQDIPVEVWRDGLLERQRRRRRECIARRSCVEMTPQENRQVRLAAAWQRCL
ncbi:MAG TPA: hypothetical protein VLJ79_18980, partial [Candidatus Binatia bacterium]|nr:hypothetical protein [Candidatus Binatia bacterium]